MVVKEYRLIVTKDPNMTDPRFQMELKFFLESIDIIKVVSPLNIKLEEVDHEVK